MTVKNKKWLAAWLILGPALSLPAGVPGWRLADGTNSFTASCRVRTDDAGWIIVENERFRLALGDDAAARSLVLKATDEELLDASVRRPFFSVTQERPYNNENKLARLNQRTTYAANRVRREGDLLVVSFDVAPYEAVVRVGVTPDYALFTLDGFRTTPDSYRTSPSSDHSLAFTAPPAAVFRIAELPVRARRNFGDWLNVVWDENASVALLGTSPETFVSGEPAGGCVTLSADADRDVRIMGVSAALVVDRGNEAILDRIDAFERDFDLPRGVANRRNPLVRGSIYWTFDLSPDNVDRHIARAKQGGFPLMLCYYSCFWSRTGDYPMKSCYPNGLADVRAVLAKVRAAGIIPGLHVLHTYVTPASDLVRGGADRRLQLDRRFTLARPLGADDTELFVDECPAAAERHERCRRLRFGREVMSYEGFTETYPYRFYGLKRGLFETPSGTHPEGETGGTLLVSEYGGRDFLVKQDSDLQDVIADRFAELWACGMGFVYFDGSEGVGPPCAYNVANSQWRVWKKLRPAPFLGEGAAKSHFSWHMLSGANAFDVFPPEKFVQALHDHPEKEVREMRKSFTRVNFGWWSFSDAIVPDDWEYGARLAASHGCPITVQMSLEALDRSTKADDVLARLKKTIGKKEWGGASGGFLPARGTGNRAEDVLAMEPRPRVAVDKDGREVSVSTDPGPPMQHDPK